MIDVIKSGGLWILSYDISRAIAERFVFLQVRIIVKGNGRKHNSKILSIVRDHQSCKLMY